MAIVLFIIIIIVSYGVIPLGKDWLILFLVCALGRL